MEVDPMVDTLQRRRRKIAQTLIWASWLVLVLSIAIAFIWENDVFGPLLIAGGILFFVGVRSFSKRFSPNWGERGFGS